MSESSSSDEEYVDTSLDKTIGGSAENEVSVATSPREEEEEAEQMVEKRVKKNNFERLWSEEDEIRLVEGVLSYQKESGNVDTKGAYEEVSKFISFDVSKIQFKEKLRSLKKKFDRKIIKAKKKGEDPTFVKLHDGKVFDMSKLLWGGNGESSVNFKEKKSKKRRRNCEEDDDDKVMNKEELVAQERGLFIKSSVVESLTRFGMEEMAASQGWSWLSIEDKEKFEQEWKALQLQKVELYSKEGSFIQAMMTKVGEAFKSNL